MKVFEDWEVISSYSRAQAIADGTLVDLSEAFGDLVREAGFRYPVAMTRAAYGRTVEVWEQELQHVRGRLWDVLTVLRLSAKDADGDRVHFTVNVWNRDKWERVRLWSLCGPGDTPEPVLTILLEGED